MPSHDSRQPRAWLLASLLPRGRRLSRPAAGRRTHLARIRVLTRLAVGAVLVLLVTGSIVATALADPRPSPGPQPAPTSTTPAPGTSGTASPGSSPQPPSPTRSSPPPPRPTAPPTPGPTPGKQCGAFEFGCQMSQAMTDYLRTLVREAIDPVFDVLGTSLLATPRMDQTTRVRELWTGSRVVANTCVVLFVVVAGIIMMTTPTLQSAYTVKDVAPRLVAGVVLANVSLVLVGKAIGFANALSAALLAPGVDVDDATKTIYDLLERNTLSGRAGVFVLWVVVIALILALVLGVIYLFRLTLTVLLIAVAPLALACHCLPQTEGIARLWWRALAGLLAIQVAQALVFLTAMRVFFSTEWYTVWGLHTGKGIADLWITVVLLYVLVRIPSWISRWIWRGGLAGSPVTRTVQVVASALVFRRATAALAAAGRAKPRRTATTTQTTPTRTRGRS